MMTDCRDKYLRAVKALGEVEQKAVENIEGLNREVMAILNHLKGQHSGVIKRFQRYQRSYPISQRRQSKS